MSRIFAKGEAFDWVLFLALMGVFAYGWYLESQCGDRPCPVGKIPVHVKGHCYCLEKAP